MTGWLCYLQQVISITDSRLDALVLPFVIQWEGEQRSGVQKGLLCKSMTWMLHTTSTHTPMARPYSGGHTLLQDRWKMQFLARWTACPAKSHSSFYL